MLDSGPPGGACNGTLPGAYFFFHFWVSKAQLVRYIVSENLNLQIMWLVV